MDHRGDLVDDLRIERAVRSRHAGEHSHKLIRVQAGMRQVIHDLTERDHAGSHQSVALRAEPGKPRARRRKARQQRNSVVGGHLV